MTTIKIDPDFKKLIPPLLEDERNRLTENLIDDGCRDPLVVWNGVLLDGHNRYEICTANDIPFETTSAPVYVRTKDDALDWIDKNQIGRRNLSRDDFNIVLGRIYNRSKKADGHRGPKKLDQNEPASTADKLAKEHGVSSATVKRAGKFAEAVEKVETEEPAVAAEGRKAVVTRARAELKKTAAPAEKESVPKSDAKLKQLPEVKRLFRSLSLADKKSFVTWADEQLPTIGAKVYWHAVANIDKALRRMYSKAPSDGCRHTLSSHILATVKRRDPKQYNLEMKGPVE